MNRKKKMKKTKKKTKNKPENKSKELVFMKPVHAQLSEMVCFPAGLQFRSRCITLEILTSDGITDARHLYHTSNLTTHKVC